MQRLIQEGEIFVFGQPTTAIAMWSPYAHDAFLGFQAPAIEARNLYKPELLTEEILVLPDDVYTAIRAYQSVTGWCVVGRRHDEYADIHFHQKLDDGNDKKHFLEAHAI